MKMCYTLVSCYKRGNMTQYAKFIIHEGDLVGRLFGGLFKLPITN